MPKYNIQRWDAVMTRSSELTGGNEYPVPMIYIKPDQQFIQYAKENDYQVRVTITGTGTVYDDKPILAVIDSSGYFPDFRPNFYNQTGYFVLTLFTQWDGYPNTGNGSVLIQGLHGPDKLTVPKETKYEPPQPIPQILEPFKIRNKKHDKMTSSQIGWLLTGIFIIFGVLLYMSANNI